MAYLEPMLFFGSGDGGDAATDAACYPLSALRGMHPASATTTTMYFKPAKMSDNHPDPSADLNDAVVVTHTGVLPRVFMQALAKAVNNPDKSARNGLIVVADADNATGVGANLGVTAWDAAITIAA